MSQTINILPAQLANKIAAGEVVQRPASAVKELLENSIDAGAHSITIVVTNGGKSSIQIIDDGDGMGPEDAVLAFSRHATSKISTLEDLERIRTLGFRGEALASIAAVGQVEMLTRRKSEEVGTRVRIEGGTVLEKTPHAGPSGTTITVRNLFYNTPGRRNFLKSETAEYKQVYDAVQRIALSHPALSLAFISGDQKILNLRPSGLAERVEAVFGPRLASSAFPFEESSSEVMLRGFLGKPDFARRTRTEQYLFLNNRSIVNRSLSHAVVKAYEHLLEKGSFPFFILYLSLDPAKFDVNVHPSKLEVKFTDESLMYRMVHSAVRNALASRDLIPVADLESPTHLHPTRGLVFTQSATPAGPRSADWRELIRTPAPAETPGGSSLEPRAGEEAGSHPAVKEGPSEFRAVGGAEAGIKPLFSARTNSGEIWQIHNKYLLMPVENGLMVVDQHAAHERVLYEKVVARFQTEGGKIQQLLFPHTFELTPGDAALVAELLPHLAELGFSVKLFGKTTVVIDGVPLDVKPGAEKTILAELIDLYKEDAHDSRLEPRERLAKGYSCRAAVKAGDPLTQAEVQALLDQLFATRVPFVCPHGRPVMIRLSLAELDKKFGRTS